MSQVSCGFLHRNNSVKFRIRAVAETFELGKDKPNPVAVFAAVFQFCHHARDNGLLRVDESLQVVIVIHKHGAQSVFILFQAMAHAKHMSIGMAQMHFANVPGHVVGRECDFEPGCNTLLVH